MHKLCARLLLALSAWLLVAPFAAASADQGLLPACCRRLGAHHCAATMQTAGDRGAASFHAAGCLLLPHPSLAWLQRLAGMVALAGFAFVGRWFPFFSTGAFQSYARAFALKSPRGPPACMLA